LAGRIEDILQCPACGAIALTDHLQHLDGGNPLSATRTASISKPFHHPEQLLDRPTLAIEVSDLLRIDQGGDGMRRQQPPMS
jgi:hypothetical protein